MRKLILTATGFICLAGTSYFFSTAWGQAGRKESAATEDVPHRIGLIDINYVMQNYDKLKVLREEFSAEGQAEQEKWTAKAKRFKELAAEMKDFQEGTPEFTARQNKLDKLGAELEGDKKVVENKMRRSSAKMLHTVYLEMQDAVEKYANYYKFTLVLQFNRTDGNSDPNKIMQMMQQPVVYYRKGKDDKGQDDLSQKVTDYLNKKYLESTGGEAKAPSNAGSSGSGSTAAKKAKGPSSDIKQTQGTKGSD